MMRQHPAMPQKKVREFANEFALELARQRLADVTDIEVQCRNAGARYDAASRAALFPYLDRPCRVTFPAGEVSFMDGDLAVTDKDAILVLDYLTRAGGAPLTGNLITYKELHDGLNYAGVFATRTTGPLARFFATDPATLLAVGTRLGGRPAVFGDAAVTFTAFPRVPLTYVIWQGDDEFPADASILFDSTVSDYLSNDDIHALCETIVWRLVKLYTSGGDNPG